MSLARCAGEGVIEHLCRQIEPAHGQPVEQRAVFTALEQRATTTSIARWRRCWRTN
jgi:hypothetical protein